MATRIGSNFSVSAILWFATLIGVGLTVLKTQSVLLENTAALKSAQEQISELREELGQLDVTQEDKNHIRFFRDHYSRDIQHWRIYCPDISKVQVCFAVGDLPDSGIPSHSIHRTSLHKLVSDRGLPAGPADLVVTIDLGMSSREFCVRSSYEYKDGTFVGGNNIFMSLMDWWPSWWDPNLRWIRKGIPMDETTQFEFEEPFLFEKRAWLNDDQLKGYMFWVEKYESPVSDFN